MKVNYRKELKILAKWLGIPPKTIKLFKFKNTFKDMYGLGGSVLHINSRFIDCPFILPTLIHEYIHWYYINSGYKGFDLDYIFNNKDIDYPSTFEEYALFIESRVECERLTDLLTLFIWGEYQEYRGLQFPEFTNYSDYLENEDDKLFNAYYDYLLEWFLLEE